MPRRKASKVQVHILMDEEDVRVLERLATQGGESLSGLIRRVMKHFIRLKSEAGPDPMRPTRRSW